MKTKTLAIIATITGSLCAAYAALILCVAFGGWNIGRYMPTNVEAKYFYWSLCAAVVFWALAGFGFVLHRKTRRNHDA